MSGPPPGWSGPASGSPPGWSGPASGSPPDSPEPFAVVARYAGGLPRGEDGGYRAAVREVLADLGRGCRVGYAALWLPAPDRPQWSPAVAWRAAGVPDVALPGPVGEPDALLTVPGVVATVDVTVGGARHGVLALAHRERPGTPPPVEPIGVAALAVGLLLDRVRAREAAAVARVRADRAARRAGVAGLELATVQAVERDRLAVAVTATPDRQLRDILARVDALERALATGAPGAAGIAATIRADLGSMIEGFRALVRGVYPQVLRGQGVRAAVEEYAAVLGVPVDCRGDLGRRESWEIESGLYQAAAPAVAALAAGGGPEPVRVELRRNGDLLDVRVGRAGADPVRVAVALADDARRLAALGGRLRVAPDVEPAESVLDGAGATVDIRLPVRLSGDWPEPRPPAPPSLSGPFPPSTPETFTLPLRPVELLPIVAAERGRAGAPGAAGGEGEGERRLVELLLGCREPAAGSVPVRAALARQDGRIRVAVVGAPAQQLVAALCGWPGEPAWEPPEPVRSLPACYRYGPRRRVTLVPGAGAPWRPVHAPDWSGALSTVDARSAPGGRIVVAAPAAGLRGLRLAPWYERADADLATRLRDWPGGRSDGRSGDTDGPPDVVVLALGGPVSAAESEFLAVLRTPDGPGFAPVVVAAVRDGAPVPPRARQWLGTACEAVVGWHPGAGGATAVAETVRTGAGPGVPAGVLAARWALRALRACRAGGLLDGPGARAVEAAAAGAYRVAELDLAQALRARRIRAPGRPDEALRLLGGYGPDARTRLGLPGGAGVDEVAGAAARALAYWRARAGSPDTPPDQRAACAALIRVCERLVAGTG